MYNEPLNYGRREFHLRSHTRAIKRGKMLSTDYLFSPSSSLSLFYTNSIIRILKSLQWLHFFLGRNHKYKARPVVPHAKSFCVSFTWPWQFHISATCNKISIIDSNIWSNLNSCLMAVRLNLARCAIPFAAVTTYQSLLYAMNVKSCFSDLRFSVRLLAGSFILAKHIDKQKKGNLVDVLSQEFPISRIKKRKEEEKIGIRNENKCYL